MVHKGKNYKVKEVESSAEHRTSVKNNCIASGLKHLHQAHSVMLDALDVHFMLTILF